jgi:hypothetical protein
MGNDAKPSRERQVFKAFVESTSLPVESGSVESRDPPEADIRCDLEDYGPTAFELVEAVDPALARRMSGQEHIQQLLQEHAQIQPLDKLSNALVSIEFNRSNRLREVKQAVPHLCAALSDLPADFEGACPLEPPLAALVNRMRITRGSFAGPAFQVDASTFVSNPIVDCIEDKLAKTYGSDVRHELLVYFDRQPPGPAEVWLGPVETLLKRQLPRSPFSRAWVFDAAERRVLYAYSGTPT